MNEWAKTGDKGKPQPDGFTPEGGLVRVHYDQDNVEDCNDDDGDDAAADDDDKAGDAEESRVIKEFCCLELGIKEW